MPPQQIEAVVALPPGEAITRLVMGVALERMGGALPVPRVQQDGTRVPFPARFLGGSGELVVTLRGEDTVVRIEGIAPPWPLSMGWQRRLLLRLLGRQVIRWSSPSSGD